jgi:hypothetical protein
MAIDKIATYKLGEELQENISIEEKKDNQTVI